MRARPAVASMLEPPSVAVVGASNRQGSFGRQMMEQITGGGFEGPIHPVNPKQGEILGLRTYPSIAEMPEPADLVMLGIPNELLEEQLSAAAEAGARGAVIFASGFGTTGEGRPLGERLRSIARDAGMAVCGPNCLGFVNLELGLRATSYHLPRELEPGPIAFISHSGSAFSAMLHNRRGLRFNVAVSSGSDLVTTMTEYLEYALELESTRFVAVFVEAVMDLNRFGAALASAGERDIPVVALKVGRTPRAAEMVAAHRNSTAERDEPYQALFEKHGVLRVRTLDEMADTLELLAAGRRAGPGDLAAIHDSGGERALLIDAADEAGVRFADLSPPTRERIRKVLDPGLPVANPLDAWGTGNRPERTFIDCMGALLENEDTAALAFCLDLTEKLVPRQAYAAVAEEIFARTEKPVAVLTNLMSAVDPGDAAYVRSLGIPVLEGTANGLAAFRHLFEYRDSREGSELPVEGPPDVGHDRPSRP